MFKLTAVASLAALALAEHPINPDIVEEIKTKTSKWTPYEVSENPLLGRSNGDLSGLLGTIVRPAHGNRQPEIENLEVPKNFDARDQWPKCIHAVRD